MNLNRCFISLLMLCPTVRKAAAAKVPAGFNEDESKVPEFVLPEVLKGKDGKVVESADQWMATRRAEVLRMLETRMFGRAPELPENVRSHISLAPADVVDGLAVRHQVTLLLSIRISRRTRIWSFWQGRTEAKHAPSA